MLFTPLKDCTALLLLLLKEGAGGGQSKTMLILKVMQSHTDPSPALPAKRGGSNTIGLTKKVIFILLVFTGIAHSQSLLHVADSIRQLHHIPELGYAIVSSDSILEMNVLGVKKVGTSMKGELKDKFRLGSNTKTITAFIAVLLAKEGKISLDTKFFDLYPELIATSRPEFRHVTLLELLSFRTQLFPYTYTDSLPLKSQFSGSEEKQRYQFAQWFFAQPPNVARTLYHFSNLDYVAAALMLEKASGKPYKQLVTELGEKLNIHFDFGQPNMIDANEPWGHDASLRPEPPGDPYKLNWLLSAGNITMDLPNFARFIQIHLAGLNGRKSLLDCADFNSLHYGLPGFAIGWFWAKDKKGNVYSYHEGNPGTFLSRAYLYKKANRAYILFCNVQSDEAEEGLDELMEVMRKKIVK